MAVSLCTHVFFIVIPTIILWIFFWKYLLRYKKTFFVITILAAFCGIWIDLIAVNLLHLWVFDPAMHYGLMIGNLPLGEYAFMFLFPPFMTTVVLLIRKVLYNIK